MVSWGIREDQTQPLQRAMTQFSRPKDWQRIGVGNLVFGLHLWWWLSACLDWRWQVLLVCVVSFRLNLGSSLQWVYHVGAPDHFVGGRYNWRVASLDYDAVSELQKNYNIPAPPARPPPMKSVPGNSRRFNVRETQPLWYRYFRIFLGRAPFLRNPPHIQKRPISQNGKVRTTRTYGSLPTERGKATS